MKFGILELLCILCSENNKENGETGTNRTIEQTIEQTRCCSSQPTSQDTTPAVTEYTPATSMHVCMFGKKIEKKKLLRIVRMEEEERPNTVIWVIQ